MSEPVQLESAESTGDSGNRAASTRYIDDADDISRVIKILRDQRADMQIRFDDGALACSAKILDLQGDSFLLEDVQPREGFKPLRAGKTFTLSARAHGIYMRCEGNRVIKADSERGIPFFHVPLPKSMLYQQRRKADRFRLPLSVTTNGASISLFRNDPDEPMTGRVIDISVGGCRAEFDGPASPPVDCDEQVDTCSISIPNLLELSAKAAIRHFSYNEQSRKLTCGIELTEMHVTDRRRLEQFIQSITRVSQSPDDSS